MDWGKKKKTQARRCLMPLYLSQTLEYVQIWDWNCCDFFSDFSTGLHAARCALQVLAATDGGQTLSRPTSLVWRCSVLSDHVAEVSRSFWSCRRDVPAHSGLVVMMSHSFWFCRSDAPLVLGLL